MKRSGFALIEMLVVLGIVGVTAGMAVPLYRDYQIRSDLNLATEQVTQGLARAQLLAQSGENDDAWGFFVPSGTLYKGQAYAAREEEYDEVYPMPSTITTTGILEVSYSKLLGNPSETGAITLTALNKDQRTVFITVEKESIAVIEAQDLTICHKPEGVTPHTLTVNEAAWPAHQAHGDSFGSCAGESSSASSVASSSSASSIASSSSSASSEGAGTAMCEDRFSVAADGTITTTGTVDVTFTALGSSITYGAGGPEIGVFVKAKKDTAGSSYESLFNGDDIDGGEVDTMSYSDGAQVVTKIRAYFKKPWWLTYDQEFATNDGTGHIYMLRDGDPLPDVDAFDNQGSIESYLANILDVNGNIDIGPYDVVLLAELGLDLSSSAADFQDAVILLEFAQPSEC